MKNKPEPTTAPAASAPRAAVTKAAVTSAATASATATTAFNCAQCGARYTLLRAPRHRAADLLRLRHPVHAGAPVNAGTAFDLFCPLCRVPNAPVARKGAR